MVVYIVMVMTEDCELEMMSVYSDKNSADIVYDAFSKLDLIVIRSTEKVL